MTMRKTCCIFGAGEYGALTLTTEHLADCLIIAADGGYHWLKEHNITPHLAVGDFDSLGHVPEDVEVLRHPAEKDDTDMMLAVLEGLKENCTRFLIYGGLGGRLDHTMANFHVLDFLARQGCEGFLLSEDTAVTAVRNGALSFSPEHRGTLSLFAWGGPAAGVTLSGLRYCMENGAFAADVPLGVSNEFTGQPSSVNVARGTVIALWTLPQNAPLPRHH